MTAAPATVPDRRSTDGRAPAGEAGAGWSGWLPAVAAVAARPALWPVALRQLGRLAATGWWRRPPFLPLPDRAYLRFRMQTAYGDPAAAPRPADMVTYLRWCRAWPRVVDRP